MQQTSKKSLLSELSLCLSKDYRRIERDIHALFETNDSPDVDKVQAVMNKIQSSKNAANARRGNLPLITFPEALPVSEKAMDIASIIEGHQVVIVAGETGSGKTTQLPKICMSLGIGARGLIGHTQPRRLAARAVANRIAEECSSTLGEAIGYQVRFTDIVSKNTYVKLMTDGILLAEIKTDPYLRKYEAIIIDEAHERSLNIDFLLGYLKTLLSKRRDLKLIVTSATIDVHRFAEFFDNAPVIEVSGRTYPVSIEYRPGGVADEVDEDLSLYEQIGRVVEEISDTEGLAGDILVFLSGEREIRDAAKHLKQLDFKHTEILPLYARLTAAEQNKIFQPHRGRRIVLSTNVAETSITVPGIRYVIDTGKARISRYSYRSKVQRLPIENVSQASANQRAGRCGRVAEGICYRLYDEQDFLSRPEFTDPEIVRTNLASVILQMADLKLGDIRRFPFIEMPDSRLINDGYKLLHELGAVNQKRHLTQLGKTLAKIPADPRLARMIVEANKLNSLSEVLIICSALASQDPREKPQEKKQAADQAHQQYADKSSDFLAFVNLWNTYENERQRLSSSQIRKYCKKHFLSYMRMREWRDIHRQLHLIVKQLGFKENQEPATYDHIHIALLSGLLGNVGEKHEKGAYKGTRNRVFYPFPGSSLFKKGPKWVVASELVETAKVYGRVLASIEPEWIEPLAKSVVKTNYFEPHWERKRGQVIGFEEVRLYGLTIVSKRRCNYAHVDPGLCRELFIRYALVYGELESKAPFYKHNQRKIEDISGMEDKFRRKDILVDEEVLFNFYDNKLPENIVSKTHFDTWWKSLDGEALNELKMSEEYLMANPEGQFDSHLFPDNLELGTIRYRLDYQFSPGNKSDGITLVTPLAALKRISSENIDWVVPGLLKEKCTQLIKSLPKQYRKNFVPVPAFVEKVLPKISSDNGALIPQLAQQLYFLSGVRIPIEQWDESKLEDYLKMNIRVVDDKQKTLFESRNLDEIIDKFGEEKIQKEAIGDAAKEWSQKHLTEWTFNELPESVTIKQSGVEVRMFPFLSDTGKEVEMSASTDALYASKQSYLGISRLIYIQLQEQVDHIKKSLKYFKQTALYYAPVGKAQNLFDDFIIAVIKNHFLPDALPRNKEQFQALVEEHRASFYDAAMVMDGLIYDIFKHWHDLMKQLKKKNINLQLAASMADVKFQLDHLVYQGFVSTTSIEVLKDIPRYLNAADIRLEKMAREMAKEREFLQIIKPVWEQYEQLQATNLKKGRVNVALNEFRWMLEEFRVSFFAQQLGTKYTISEKRLQKQWQEVERLQFAG